MTTRKRKPRAAAAPEPAPEEWATLEWKGRPLYQCRSCAYNTTDIGAIRPHVRYSHRARRPRTTATQE